MNRRDFMKHAAITGAALSAATGAEATRLVPPSDRLAFGLIGAGARGQELLEAAQRVPGVSIVGLSDAYKAAWSVHAPGRTAPPRSTRTTASCSAGKMSMP